MFSAILGEGLNIAETILLKGIALYREATDLGCDVAKENLAEMLNDYGYSLLTGTNELNEVEINVPKSIELLKESLNLGCTLAGRKLVTALNTYAMSHINGANGIKINLSKAADLLKEAILLGYEPINDLGYSSPQENLAAISLLRQAAPLINKTDGIERNLTKAIELLKEAIELRCEAVTSLLKKNLTIAINLLAADYNNGTNGLLISRQKAVDLLRESMLLDTTNKDAENNLPIALDALGADYFNGENGVEKDIHKALEYFKEASRLGFKDATDNACKVLFVLDQDTFNKAKILNNDANNHMMGENGAEQNIPKAIKMLRKSAAMGYEPAFINLRAALHELSSSYVQGIKGCEKSRSKAIESLRESLSLGYKPAQEILPLMLSDYAIELANGSNGVVKNLPESIKLLREAIELGGRIYTNLAIVLCNYAIELANGSKKADLFKAIKLAQESVRLGYKPARKTLAALQSLLE